VRWGEVRRSEVRRGGDGGWVRRKGASVSSDTDTTLVGRGEGRETDDAGTNRTGWGAPIRFRKTSGLLNWPFMRGQKVTLCKWLPHNWAYDCAVQYESAAHHACSGVC